MCNIISMNDRKMDLNLLYVFYWVMMEKNVTRAAERMAITQPAASNALSRLRYVFQDDLFTKASGGVRPTKKALAIWPDIQETVATVRGLIGSPEFEPATAHQVFHVAVWDALRHSLVPGLAVHLAMHAPHVTLFLRPQTLVSTIVDLESGALDCAVGIFSQVPTGLQVNNLFTDKWVGVMRKRNPLLHRRLSLKEFAAADHVLVRPSGSGYGIIDEWLGRKGLTRHVSLVVNHFEDALEAAKRTDLVATIPRRLAWMVDRTRCESVPLPFANEMIRCDMVWHERTSKGASQVWLRSLIRDLINEHCQHGVSRCPKPLRKH
jgi:DNA-binding transcriptional LysR family regulator